MRLAGALLRAQRKGVLVGARHLVFLGDVLAGLRHRIDAVLLLHQRIDEAPADAWCRRSRRARWNASCALPMTSGARVIDSTPPAIDEVDLAGADRAGGIADRIEAGGAQPVDGDARHASPAVRRAAAPCGRRCGCPRRPGWRSRRSPRRAPPSRRFGCRAISALMRHRGEIVGAHLGERAAVAADRRASGVADEDVASSVIRCSLGASPWARAVRSAARAGRRVRARSAAASRRRSARNAPASRIGLDLLAGDAGMDRGHDHFLGRRVGLEDAEIGDELGRALGLEAEARAVVAALAVAERGEEVELLDEAARSTGA